MKKIISLILCLTMLLGTVTLLASCKKNQQKQNPDALVIMSEELDGLFNPFYSTTGADGTIVSMTQIGMLTTDYKNNEAVVAFGDKYAVVTKDYASSYDGKYTTYTFVLKNGIKFSDGHPLTMEDVLFNLYVYLDPVYTGSSTMYSTDIVGLKDYRTQTFGADSGNVEDTITSGASTRAKNRINELITLFMQTGKTPTAGSYSATVAQMKDAISKHSLSSGYKEAVSADPSKVTNAQLLADYKQALKLFEEELYTDYASAKDAYTEEPYKSTGEFDAVTSFMYAEGLVTLEYGKKLNSEGKEVEDKSKIVKVNRQYNSAVCKDMDSAVQYVYDTKVEQSLHEILTYWATAQKMLTEFTAKAKEVILDEKMEGGELKIKNISGIVSLGHSATAADKITVNGTEYTIAKQHNADGTPAVDGTYDVLQIKINGIDPKAVWNFAFAVAPQHYYAEGRTVDIANNKFGVEYNSFDFMKNEIQSTRNIKVPMGAGAYQATDANNNSNPDGNAFYSNNVVYFKRNDNFLLGQPKIEKVRYQVVSATNAISVLESGAVHFVTPQFTQNNIDKLNSLKGKGMETDWTDQLGYGYIGINARLVPDINLRKAIMAAMDTSLALSYYSTGMAETIYWPMSIVSWAYPKDEQGKTDRDNLHSEYIAVRFDREFAKKQIQDYMLAAGVSEGDSALSIKFTIAGANLTDHPTYQTFQSAANLLNECGWDIEVVPDTQALTKLSTGSLAVWAAAWGSTIDPDMYQVYHNNSTATSTLAWGYNAFKQEPGKYVYENSILNQLSDKIDAARETNDQKERAALYKEAMGYVLDLTVEMPVYQRKVLYAYNANVIKTSTLPADINPYSSPLDRIWDIEFAN